MTTSQFMYKRMRASGTQTGLTMVELLVALTLSGLIALAAIASLTVARRGFTTVDSSSQLRDNARFATDLIQRLAGQAGYQDFERANQTRAAEIKVAGATALMPEPFVKGFNNAVLGTASPPASVARNRTSGLCTSGDDDSTCLNGSDVLILRYQTQSLPVRPGSAPVSDKALIDCMGLAVPDVPSDINFRTFAVISALHVRRSSAGEPALMCTKGTDTNFPVDTQPIIQGVESFQVLYGLTTQPPLDPSQRAASDTGRYDLPDLYLNAQELQGLARPASAVTAGDADYWWRQVRSLRIAMLLRGPKNTNQDRATEVFPMLAASNSRDPGSRITFTDGVSPSPAANSANFVFPQDGRQRQVATFTVYLRNDQAPLEQR